VCFCILLFYCMFGSWSKAVGIGQRLHKVLFLLHFTFSFPLLFFLSFYFLSAVFIFACLRELKMVFQQHKWFPVLMTVSPLPVLSHTCTHTHTHTHTRFKKFNNRKL